MGLSELSQVLWRERQLLEMLLFKLEEEQMILSTGRTQWLPHATREVEAVLTQIRSSELGRAVEADSVAQSLGLERGASLTAIADHAPEPWNELLREHHQAFVTLTAQLSTLAASNKEILARSARATQETLMGLGDASTQTYSPHGAPSVASAPTAHLIDQAL